MAIRSITSNTKFIVAWLAVATVTALNLWCTIHLFRLIDKGMDKLDSTPVEEGESCYESYYNNNFKCDRLPAICVEACKMTVTGHMAPYTLFTFIPLLLIAALSSIGAWNSLVDICSSPSCSGLFQQREGNYHSFSQHSSPVPTHEPLTAVVASPT